MRLAWSMLPTRPCCALHRSAHDYMEQALETRRVTLDEDDPMISVTMYQMAGILRLARGVTVALPMAREAVQRLRSNPGASGCGRWRGGCRDWLLSSSG